MRTKKRNLDSSLKYKLLGILSHHIGRLNAIGMGALYTKVFGREWAHKINDTRYLRYLVTELRKEGHMVASCGDGYYLPATGSEREEFLKKFAKPALHSLWLVSRMRRRAVSEAEFGRQLRLLLGGE